MTSWPKRCACGATWTQKDWIGLPFLAHWKVENGPTHELRHCTCSTTLAVDVEALDRAPESSAAGV